jgi:Rieske 2Fe-2S family protein
MSTTQATPTLIPTLPGVAYDDPAVFALEQERIFERVWFCAADSRKLTEPGAFVTSQIGRESVIVTRARDGAPRAYLNVCRHRGSTICSEAEGKVKRAFRCPYHAWTYDLSGKLIAAPNIADLGDIDRTAYGLHSLHVREWLGYVWVCLAEEAPSFEATVIAEVVERLGDVASIDHYETEKLAVGRHIAYEVRANWKLIVENFMECYHCATIHPELTQVLPEFADGYAAQYYVGHGAEFGEDIQGFTVDGRPGVEEIPGVPDHQDRRYYALTVKPHVFVNLIPDHVVFMRMVPLTVDHTRVEADWLYLPNVVEEDHDIEASSELFHRVNQQDFDACECCQPRMSSRSFARGGVLVPVEHHIGAFHRWVLDQLGEEAAWLRTP